MAQLAAHPASPQINRLLSAELIALLDVEDSHAHIKFLGVLSHVSE